MRCFRSPSLTGPPGTPERAKKTIVVSCVRVLLAALCVGAGAAVPRAQTDLDALMRQVLAKRDENWKKLQQYVLDEHEQIELRAPGRVPMWGDRRDYTWYIRDGFFVRSPLRANGVEIADADRRKYEAEYLKRAQERDKRGRAGDDAAAEANQPADLDGILKQTRQPQFVSSAYFLRFKFEEGKYAFVGRETVDGRDALRIEYYPERLFTGTDRRHRRGELTQADLARDAEFRRLMNKVALVTLWVDPSAHQIVKYTFDNVAFDFLPAQWLVHVDSVKATMTMSQPFVDVSDVWLPRSLDVSVAMTLASGQFDLRYALEYVDYRRPDVTTKVGIKER